jgi:hypothetical protein
MPIAKFESPRMTRRVPFVNFNVVALIVLSTVAIPSRIVGQTAAPDRTPPGSPTSAPPQTPAPSRVPQLPPAVDRPVSWKRLFPNIVRDQERIWSFPARLVQGQSWIPTVAVLGTTAGLVALDPTEAGFFRRTPSFQGFNKVFTGNATVVGTLMAPVSFTLSGWPGKTRKCNERRCSQPRQSPTPRL